MKSCKGCKHLVSFWCHQNTELQYVKDPYTEKCAYKYTQRPITARENREYGACGEHRKLFEPSFTYNFKIWNWITGRND